MNLFLFCKLDLWGLEPSLHTSLLPISSIRRLYRLVYDCVGRFRIVLYYVFPCFPWFSSDTTRICGCRLRQACPARSDPLFRVYRVCGRSFLDRRFFSSFIHHSACPLLVQRPFAVFFYPEPRVFSNHFFSTVTSRLRE